MVIVNANLSNTVAARIDLSTVTQTQIGAAHKILSSAGNYYLVENSRGLLDENGDIIEYKVSYSSEHHCFHCTCPAGNPPVDASGQPLYAPRLCWHIRAALACEKEMRAALAALAEQARCQLESYQLAKQRAEQAPVLIVDGVCADELTIQRVFSAQPAPVRRVKTYQPKAFSLLR